MRFYFDAQEASFSKYLLWIEFYLFTNITSSYSSLRWYLITKNDIILKY